MTTHELARLLLAGSDLPVFVPVDIDGYGEVAPPSPSECRVRRTLPSHPANSKLFLAVGDFRDKLDIGGILL